MALPVSSTRTAFLNAAKERILVLDGAMGTMIQALQFDEAAFRSARFADFHRDVKGNNDLLILTQPKAIEDIHAAYLRAVQSVQHHENVLARIVVVDHLVAFERGERAGQAFSARLIRR